MTGTDTNESHNRTLTDTSSRGWQKARGKSVAITDQPGVKHIPLWEPEYWTLEEQRWKASEALMHLPVGSWFVSTPGGCGFGSSPLPPAFYIPKDTLLRLCREFHEGTSYSPEKAEELIAKRQRLLLTRAHASARDAQTRREAASDDAAQAVPIWDGSHRTAPAISPPVQTAQVRPPHGAAVPRKRGPKPDVDNHRKVQEIVEGFGEKWTNDEALAEIADLLDKAHVPVPKKWAFRRDGKSRSRQRALEHYPGLVIKTIKDRLDAAKRDSS